MSQKIAGKQYGDLWDEIVKKHPHFDSDKRIVFEAGQIKKFFTYVYHTANLAGVSSGMAISDANFWRQLRCERAKVIPTEEIISQQDGKTTD